MANYLTLLEQLSTAVDQLNEVLQGDENTTVTINGQQQPSVQKKTLDEVNAKIQLVLDAAADIDAVKYATTADGIASGADYFSVVSQSSDIYLDLYKNEAGNAVFQKSYPSLEGVTPEQIIDAYNTNKPVSGQAVYNAVNEGNVFADNKIANSDFASGSTTPFNTERWNTTSVVGGAFVGESSGVGGWSYIRQYPTYSVGDKIYFTFSAHSPTAGKQMVFQNQINDFTIAKDIAANEWTRFSGIRAGVVNSYNAVYGIFGTTAGEIYKLKNIMFINLTEVFGAGNEPDILDLESMLGSFQNGYFNGTQKILSTKNILPLVKINKSSRLNVTNTYPLTSGYYTKQRAREAVPPSLRQLGLKLTYQTSANQWEDDQFIGDNLGGWLNSNNWLSNRQSIDLNQSKKSYGVEGAASFFDIQSYVGDTFSGDFCLEAVFTPKKQNDPEITYILNDGLVGVNVRKRLTSQFEFVLKDGDGNRLFLRKTTEVNKPVHIALFVIGNVAEMYADGVFVDSVTLSNGLFGTPYSLLRFFEATSLFRVSATSTQNALERFNNGRPNSYIATDVVLEYKEDGITPTYFRENVSGEYYDYTDGDAVAIDAMYPLEKTGAGAPTFKPQFARQRYFDTTNKAEYIALGNTQPTDWVSITTSNITNKKQDILVSGSNIKTINGVSVLGSGNLTVGGGGVSVESKAFEIVEDYGAVGNGVVYDTTALENAAAAAASSALPVLLTRKYRIRRGLIAKNNVQFIAAKGAQLIRDASITQAITEDMVVGQEFVKVSDANAYSVGQEIYILEPQYGAGGLTSGIISDITGNTIMFTSPEGQSGSVANYSTSNVVVTSAFSMIRSNPTIDTVNNVVDGIDFITNPQPTDPLYYFCAIIHFNAASANTIVQNCKINGSTADGISLQGRDRLEYTNNELLDIAENSMHFGTTAKEIFIEKNTVKRGGRNGVFWCFNNNKVVVTNNHFIDTTWGCGEIDFADRESIIAHNTFDNCVAGVYINGGYDFSVNNNLFTRMKANHTAVAITGSVEGGVSINDNLFTDFDAAYSGDCISVADTSIVNITGNIIKGFTGTGSAINIDDNRGACESVIISLNNISGDGSKGVTLTNTKDSMVVNNIIEVGSGGTHIVKNGTNNGLVETPNILK